MPVDSHNTRSPKFKPCQRRDGSTVASVESEPASREAVMCTLDVQGARQRAREFRAVFDRAYLTGERLGDGVRWRFRRSDGLLDELQRLANQEHECCRFFVFELTAREQEVWWDTRASAAGQAVLEEFFALPKRLASGAPDDLIESMTRVFPSVPQAPDDAFNGDRKDITG